MKKTTQSQKGKKPHNWKAWGIGIAAVLVIGVIGIIGDGGKQPEQPSASPSVSMSIAPSASMPEATQSLTLTPPPESSTPVQETESGNNAVIPSSEPPVVTESLTPAPSAEPNQPEPTPVNTPEPVASQAPAQGEIVWASKTGKSYHNNPECSGMKNPIQMTLDEAIASGRTACSNCYG